MNNMDLIAPSIICICLVFLIFYMLYALGFGITVSEEYVADEETLQILTDQRNNIINNIVFIVVTEFNLAKEDVQPQYEAMGFNKDLITLDFLYNKLRIYCDWNKNTIKFAFTCNYSVFHYKTAVKMKIKSGTLDFERLEKIVHHWSYKTTKGIFPDTGSFLAECIAAAKDIANDENFSDEQALKMLFQAWQGSKLRNTKRHQKDDMIDFIRFTGFLLRFYPKELLDFIKENKAEITGKAKEDENEEVRE